MGYSFIDTTTSTPGTASLPAEAVSVNGDYIENLISGYRTLYVSGRESLAKELDLIAVGSADGETLRSTRYPARELTVGYQLIASSDSDFRSKYNHLFNILSDDEVDFVFNDEQDKFFTGTPILSEDIDPGCNSVTGEWKIYCADPFKYSVDPIVKTTDDATGVTIDGNTATFTFNYNGTYPAHPILKAEFAGALSGGDYSQDGDCGFVAWMDEDENIIQLGNPDAVDEGSTASTATSLANRQFVDVAGWTASGWSSTWGSKTIDGSMSVVNKTDTYWNKGSGAWVKSCANPTFGSGSGWHGPLLWKSTTGAKNFKLSIVHRLCCNKSSEYGTFECGVWNTAGETPYMLAGFVIAKTASGTKGTVSYIVNGAVVGSGSINLAYYNTNFGYCKRTPVYKTQYYNKKTKKWQDKKIKGAKTKKVTASYKYTQSNLNSSIEKSGSKIVFSIGNLAKKTFEDSNIENVLGHNVSMHFGQKASKSALNTNCVQSVLFTDNKENSTFGAISNVFTAGDIVEADCNDASVYLMRLGTVAGEYAPEYGALGNDWESFTLERGSNTISCAWSDWVNETYKPKISIIYNEVFI